MLTLGAHTLYNSNVCNMIICHKILTYHENENISIKGICSIRCLLLQNTVTTDTAPHRRLHYVIMAHPYFTAWQNTMIYMQMLLVVTVIAGT